MIAYSSNPQSKLNTAMANLKRVTGVSEPAERHFSDYDTTIAGIPCGIVVQSYTAPKAWRQHTFKGAGPGDCDPPEPAEVEFFVVDRKGYRAKWLERKADWSKLTREVLERVNGLRY